MTRYRRYGLPGSTDACCRRTKGFPIAGLRVSRQKMLTSSWSEIRKHAFAISQDRRGVKIKPSRIVIHETSAAMESASKLTGEVVSSSDMVVLQTRACKKHNCAESAVISSTSAIDTKVAPRPDAWNVFAIVDRAPAGRGFRYRVKWCDEPGGHRWDDTWEPGYKLRKDGFQDACRVVDAWKASNEGDFYRFCTKTGHARLVGASSTGLCAVHAIGVSADLLNIEGWNSESALHDFQNQSAEQGHTFSQNGMTYGELRHYVKFVNDRRRDVGQISVSALDSNLLGGLKGKTTIPLLRSLDLDDGVYICAAFNSMGVSHCIAIQSIRGAKFIYDEDHKSVPLHDYDITWVYGISFLRRVVLYKRRSTK